MFAQQGHWPPVPDVSHVSFLWQYCCSTQGASLVQELARGTCKGPQEDR